MTAGARRRAVGALSGAGHPRATAPIGAHRRVSRNAERTLGGRSPWTPEKERAESGIHHAEQDEHRGEGDVDGQ